MDVYEGLTRELGGIGCFAGGAVAPYARDDPGWGRTAGRGCPVRSREEVELVLRFRGGHQIPVTPRGAGAA